MFWLIGFLDLCQNLILAFLVMALALCALNAFKTTLNISLFIIAFMWLTPCFAAEYTHPDIIPIYNYDNDSNYTQPIYPIQDNNYYTPIKHNKNKKTNNTAKTESSVTKQNIAKTTPLISTKSIPKDIDNEYIAPSVSAIYKNKASPLYPVYDPSVDNDQEYYFKNRYHPDQSAPYKQFYPRYNPDDDNPYYPPTYYHKPKHNYRPAPTDDNDDNYDPSQLFSKPLFN